MSDATRVKRMGRDAGFDLVRIAPATELQVERSRFLQWIEHNRQGEMRWITADHALKSSDPGRVLDGAESVISVGLGYWGGHRPSDGRNSGRIARYAWGADYHRVLGDRLRDFAERLVGEFGGRHRWYVDTGPLMDKALAARSGLGWYGKNTNILTEQLGSFVLLGEIVTTVQLQPDRPLDRSCGACRLCVVACPTGALGPDYSIDSRKCISYLTIEHRGPIPHEYRSAMGNWVFGCDICQDVCPPTMSPYLSDREERSAWTMETREILGHGRSDHDGKSSFMSTLPTPEGHPLFQEAPRPSIDLVSLLEMSHDQYVETFRGTSIKRAKVWMLRRNAAVALGNTGSRDSLEPLRVALVQDEHPIVRGHAAWAIGRLCGRYALSEGEGVLRSVLGTESDAGVREEINLALAVIGAENE